MGEYFVEPQEVEMDIQTFLQRLDCPSNDAVYYLQSQNNNLKQDFPALLHDTGHGVPFAEKAFGYPPDASNVWIGDDRSSTSLHKGSSLFMISGSLPFIHLE